MRLLTPQKPHLTSYAKSFRVALFPTQSIEALSTSSPRFIVSDPKFLSYFYRILLIMLGLHWHQEASRLKERRILPYLSSPLWNLAIEETREDGPLLLNGTLKIAQVPTRISIIWPPHPFAPPEVTLPEEFSSSPCVSSDGTFTAFNGGRD